VRFPAVSSSFRSARISSGSLGTIARAVAPSGKRRILPQVTKHLQKCDFPLPKNPLTHSAALTRLTNVGEKRAQYTLDAVGILTLANKRGEFIAQFLESICGRGYRRFAPGPG